MTAPQAWSITWAITGDPDGVTLTNFTFCSDGSTTPCTGASVNLASNTAAFNVDLNNVNGFDVLVATTMAHLSGDVSF